MRRDDSSPDVVCPQVLKFPAVVKITTVCSMCTRPVHRATVNFETEFVSTAVDTSCPSGWDGSGTDLKVPTDGCQPSVGNGFQFLCVSRKVCMSNSLKL